MDKVIVNADKKDKVIAIITADDGYLRGYISHVLYLYHQYRIKEMDASGMARMAEMAAYGGPGRPDLAAVFVGDLDDADALVETFNNVPYPEYRMQCRPLGYCAAGGAKKGPWDDIDRVCVIPTYPGGDIITMKEYWKPAGRNCLGFPSGMPRPGESPTEAAMRILKEKTGLDAVRALYQTEGYTGVGMPGEKAAVVGLEVDAPVKGECRSEDRDFFRGYPQNILDLTPGTAKSGSLLCFLLGYCAAQAQAKKEADETGIFGMIVENLRDYSEGDIWTTGDVILCRTESAANAIADMVETFYKVNGKDVCVTTGYYDPEEDERNGEVDSVTGWWYVDA